MAVSHSGSAAVVDRIAELNAQVVALAEQASWSSASQPYAQLLLGGTMERVSRRLAAVGTGSATTAELCELLGDLNAVQATLRKHSSAQPSYAPGRIYEALARLRDKADAQDVLDSAPAQLCVSLGFDRAMISGINGSIWTPRRLFLSDGLDWEFHRELGEYIAALEIPLASPMVEAEVVRRRLAALVSDAQREPRTYRPLMDISRTGEYVVAPIVTGSAVLGLLHADTYLSRRPLTAADRDSIRGFAEGVGLIYERAVLESRLIEQREHLSRVFLAAERIVDTSRDEPARLPGPAARVATAITSIDTPERSAPEILARLTGREREVLALLASGATNAQVADRLTVAESTVKSHVKHILHKMGTPNRAGAIARYVRAKNNERRV
ncbi:MULTISPECIES: LuxR family transcriptional regulator [Nocardia]|uniref:LuxR family transcriptional regulator n=1 Tax=Nocardia TaxID=1817 RepID=UPI001E548D2F|nr:MULTISPECIES: LuxR family transcriptional regulator [Nocardia]